MLMQKQRHGCDECMNRKKGSEKPVEATGELKMEGETERDLEQLVVE